MSEQTYRPFRDNRHLRITLQCKADGCTATHQVHWLCAEDMQARGWWCPGHDPNGAAA